MIKKSNIPTILAIVILIAGVLGGTMLLKNVQIFKIGASPKAAPENVRLSNVSDTSVTISWTTQAVTTSFISYGTTRNVGSVFTESSDNQKFFTHSIIITGLTPQTTYYYKINSDGTMYDNNGLPWQFTTGSELTSSQISIPVSGNVITASGEPSKRALVYVTVDGYLLSTLTSDQGNFVMQLGITRTPDLSSYAQINVASTLLEISVQSESGEISTAKIFPQSANPTPTLIIGQDKDYRALEPNVNGQTPNADLSLPQAATKESKFNVSSAEVTPSTTVTLSSVNDGETVSSDKPQFFGSGPTGEQITITVHSDTSLTGTTTVNSKGSWSWSPPTNLAQGAHTVTVSWIDTSGITRTLTRNFVVQAGELPSFVSSPSASPLLSPTPIATSTPRPTATPRLSASPSATPQTLPKSGSLTPTVLLSIMGLIIVTLSVYLWKESES